MLGLVLLYVGAGIFLNGLTMLGQIAPRESVVMNRLLGGLSLFVSLLQISAGKSAGIRAAAFGLLFSFTHLWVAYGHLSQQNGRGLGWFCLFVATTAALVPVDVALEASTFGEHWTAVNWAAWTILWAAFFVIGTLQRTRWTRPVAWMTITQALFTAWLPCHLMRTGRLA